MVLEILCENVENASLSVSPCMKSNEIVVDISSNRGPLFNQLIDFADNAVLIYLQIDQLLHILKVKSHEQNAFTTPLYSHLIKAWGECAQRETREYINQPIKINLEYV